MTAELEENLIERATRKDGNAFSGLMRIYRTRLYSYLLRLSLDRESAQDIFQEVLIKIWKAMPGYDNNQKFSSWIFSIAHNAAIDHLRKRNREFVGYLEEEPGNTDGYSVQEELESRETLRKIRESLKKLSDKQRNVFLLRTEGELTFKEISELTGEPLNTVLSHMRYAALKLRNSLKVNDEIR